MDIARNRQFRLEQRVSVKKVSQLVKDAAPAKNRNSGSCVSIFFMVIELMRGTGDQKRSELRSVNKASFIGRSAKSGSINSYD